MTEIISSPIYVSIVYDTQRTWQSGAIENLPSHS